MHLNRRQSLVLVAGAFTMPFASWADGSAPDEATIEAAYLYLLARALVIRQERMDMAAAGAAHNVIRYNPLGSADFVNPNFDVAYLEAWFAVDERTPHLRNENHTPAYFDDPSLLRTRAVLPRI